MEHDRERDAGKAADSPGNGGRKPWKKPELRILDIAADTDAVPIAGVVDAGMFIS